MKKLSIKNIKGKILQLNLPENLTEVSLSNKIAFDVSEEDNLLWLKDQIEKNTLKENSVEYLFKICHSLHEFFDIPMKEFIDLNIGHLIEDNIEIDLKTFEKILKGYDIDEVIDSLESLYNYIRNLLNSYKFEFRNDENFEFKYQGDSWQIPYKITNLLYGGSTFSEFSVGQSIEILQVKRFLKNYKDKSNIKNIRFMGFLKIIACTTKKQDEEFPLDESKFHKFIDDRIKYFSKIDVKTAYDVGFFLISSIRN